MGISSLDGTAMSQMVPRCVVMIICLGGLFHGCRDGHGWLGGGGSLKCRQ